MSDHIPLVHNYCDGWCERCRLAQRCLIGIQEAVRVHPRTEEDLVAEVSESLSRAMAMLYADAASRGIDLDELEEGEPLYQPVDEPLVKRSREWLVGVHAWLGEVDPDGEEEVIGRLSMPIATKIYRAEAGRPAPEDAAVSDSNGSAKVAVLMLGEVLGALTDRLERHPLDRRALGLLGEAAGILEEVQARFPQWESFVRPGFDE